METIKPMSRKKALYVWWYYHWYIVLIVLGALALITWILITQFSRKEPDYRIGVVSTEDLPLDTADAIVRELEQFCEDQNGDGTILIELNQYNVDFDAANEDTNAYSQMSGVIKLGADIRGDDGCDIFLVADPAGFEVNTEILRYLDGTVPESEDEYQNWEEMCYAWTDCPVLTALSLGEYRGYTLMDNQTGDSQDVMAGFYICRRILENDEQKENSAASEELWNRLTEGAVSR